LRYLSRIGWGWQVAADFEPRNDEKSPGEPQKGAIFRVDFGLPTPGDGSCAGESVGRGGKIDGNLSFGTALPKLRPPFAGFVLALACSSGFGFARDKRGIGVELKGKKRRTRDLAEEL
jgi:hypothetical protein